MGKHLLVNAKNKRRKFAGLRFIETADSLVLKIDSRNPRLGPLLKRQGSVHLDQTGQLLSIPKQTLTRRRYGRYAIIGLVLAALCLISIPRTDVEAPKSKSCETKIRENLTNQDAEVVQIGGVSVQRITCGGHVFAVTKNYRDGKLLSVKRD
jgi:hypothetical protein